MCGLIDLGTQLLIPFTLKHCFASPEERVTNGVSYAISTAGLAVMLTLTLLSCFLSSDVQQGESEV